MDDWAALRLALDLLHVPWRVRLVKNQPLPGGVALLLSVAADDAASEDAAVKATGRPREVVREAATFFIEQVLLCAEADSYRVLGAGPHATSNDLRRNMALLMRWMHPDVAPRGDRADRSVFAPRIAAAWNNLKTAERRGAYDSERQGAAGNRELVRSASQESRSGSGRSRRSTPSSHARRVRLPRILRAFLLGKSRY
jgi:hypothetical protein